MENTKPTQPQVLKLFKRVRTEYRKGEHSLSRDLCILCTTFLIEDNNWSQGNCKRCPMYVFKDNGTHGLPCMNRRCEPVDCGDACFDQDREINRVKKFYDEIIKVVESKTTEQLQKPSAWKFMLKIDAKVSEEIDAE